MSASTVTPKTRDTIYDRLLSSFLKEGNDFVLEKHFALGKGWDTNEIHFLYQYLNLLCSFSCDVNHYFNEKLKALATLECETKISLNEIISENDKYSVVVQKTDNITLIQCLLKDITNGINDNESKTLYVSEADLVPYTGSLEEKIAAYISDQGYDKDGIDSDLWVEYEGNPV